jgi:hypothetical protein
MPQWYAALMYMCHHALSIAAMICFVKQRNSASALCLHFLFFFQAKQRALQYQAAP